jgi:hypothetical protein
MLCWFTPGVISVWIPESNCDSIEVTRFPAFLVATENRKNEQMDSRLFRLRELDKRRLDRTSWDRQNTDDQEASWMSELIPHQEVDIMP